LQEEPLPESAEGENLPQPEQAEETPAPAAPVVEESSGEVLEDHTAGGTYWEE
jgi:hypothetical protein